MHTIVSSSTDASTQAAWDLVCRFVQQNDVSASFALYQLLQTSLSNENVSPPSSSPQPPDVNHTLAPRMLRQCFNGQLPPSSMSPSVVLYICMLNRIFCLKMIPTSQAQAVECRATGLGDLLSFYLSLVTQPSDVLALPAQRQLCLCLAALALLLYEDVIQFLEEAYTSVVGGRCPSHLYWLLLTSVMDVLSDSRVPLGSIRRVTQRRRVQERLHIALAPVQPTAQGEVEEQQQQRMFLQQTEVVDKAIGFLLEGMTGEPQEAAATFWAQLPGSTLWQWIVQRFRLVHEQLMALTPAAQQQVTEADVRSLLPATVVDCVCHVLRCVTVADEPAQLLLTSLLPVTLSLMRVRGSCVAACAVVASALEASTEDVVLHKEPGSPIFQLISSSAEQLVELLGHFSNAPESEACGVPAEAVLSACEGVSALTQVLMPVPIPVMEPDDDPEDFSIFTECLHKENADKDAAVRVLRPFLAGCQQVLLQRLTEPNAFGREDWEVVADYIRSSMGITNDPYAGDNDQDSSASAWEEDYQILFDEVSLALFTTYERVTKLLRELPAAASAQAANRESIVGVCCSAEACLGALLACASSFSGGQEGGEVVPARAMAWLLPQAALLPALIARYARSPRKTGSSTAPSAAVWPVNTWAAVVATLSAALEAAAQDRNLEAGVHIMRGVADVIRASARVVRREAQPTGGSGIDGSLTGEGALRVLQLTGTLDRAVHSAWRCLMLPGPRRYRRQLAEDIALVLDITCPSGAVVADPLLNAVMKQEAATQVAILAACRMDAMESFLYVLRCVESLSLPEDEAVVAGAGPRLRRRAASLLSNTEGEHTARCAEFAGVMDAWQAQHPSWTVLALQLAECLPYSERAELRTRCALRFFSSQGALDTDGATLLALLGPCIQGHRYLHDVSSDMVSCAPSELGSLLEALARPHPSYHTADASVRLRALTHAFTAVVRQAVGDGRTSGASLAPSSLWRLFIELVERCREALVVRSVLKAQDTASASEDNGVDGELTFDAVLDDLSTAGMVLLEAAADALRGCSSPSAAPWLARMTRVVDSHELRSVIKTTVGL